MGYTVISPEDVEWRTRPTEPGEAERHMAPLSDLAGFEIHVEANTPLQIVNEADEELLMYAYGAPPEHGHAEFLDSAV